jgi:hypothetical protein
MPMSQGQIPRLQQYSAKYLGYCDKNQLGFSPSSSCFETFEFQYLSSAEIALSCSVAPQEDQKFLLQRIQYCIENHKLLLQISTNSEKLCG